MPFCKATGYGRLLFLGYTTSVKIVVLSGDDQISSRNRYFKIIDTLKKRGWEHVTLDASKKISEQLVSSSLFEVERIYTIDNPSKVNDKEYTWIFENADKHEGSLLIYFNKSIPAIIKRKLPKSTEYEEFKLPQKLFSFLDTVYPGNAKRSVQILHDVLETNPVELVLAMLSRQLKDLYLLKNGALNAPDWKKSKLNNQLNKFKENTLETLISNLSEADVKSKTGKGDLTTLLDLILVKL